MDAQTLVIENQEDRPALEKDFSKCCYNDSPVTSTCATEIFDPVEISTTNNCNIRNVTKNLQEIPSSQCQTLEIKDEPCLFTQQHLEETSLNELRSVLAFLTPKQIDCIFRIHKIKRKDELVYLNIGQLQEMGISEPQTVLALMKVAVDANLRKQENDSDNQTSLNTSRKVDTNSDVVKFEFEDSDLQLIKDGKWSQETTKDEGRNKESALALQIQKDFGNKFKIFLSEVDENVNKANEAFLSVKVKDMEPQAKFEKLRSLYECIKCQENRLEAHWQTYKQNISFPKTRPVTVEQDCAFLVKDKEGRDGLVIGNEETEHIESDPNRILLPTTDFLVCSLGVHESRSAQEDCTKGVDISRAESPTQVAINEIVDLSGFHSLEKTNKEVAECVSDLTHSLNQEENSISHGNQTLQKIEENSVVKDVADNEKSLAHECMTTKDITTLNKVKLLNMRRKSPRFQSNHRPPANIKQQKSHESPKRKTETLKPKRLRLTKSKGRNLPRKPSKYSVCNDMNNNSKSSAASTAKNPQNIPSIFNPKANKTDSHNKGQPNDVCSDIDLENNALQQGIGEANDDCNKTKDSKCHPSLNLKSSLVKDVQDNVAHLCFGSPKASEIKSSSITTTNVDPRLRIIHKNKSTSCAVSEVRKLILPPKTEVFSKITTVKRSFEANADMPSPLKACKQENKKKIVYEVPSPKSTVLRNLHEAFTDDYIDIAAERNCKLTPSDFSLYNKSPTHDVKREISFESSFFNTTIIALPKNAGGSISSPSPIKNDASELDMEIDGRMRYPPIPYILYEIDLSRNTQGKLLQINKLIKANALDPRVFRNQLKKEELKNPTPSTCYQIYDSPTHVSPPSTSHGQPFLNDPRNRSHSREIQSPMTAPSPQPSAQNAVVCYKMDDTTNLMPASVMSHPMPATPLFTHSEKQNPSQVLYHYLNISPWYQRLMTYMKMEINYTLSHLLRALHNFQLKQRYDPEAIFDIFKIESCGDVLKILSDLGLIVESNGNIVEDRNSSLYGTRPSTAAVQNHAGISQQRSGETMQQRQEAIRGISTCHNPDRLLLHMMNPSSHCSDLRVADCLNESDSFYLETPQPIAGYGLHRDHVPPISPISKSCCCCVKTKHNFNNDHPCQKIKHTSPSSSHNHCYNNNSRYSNPSPYSENNSLRGGERSGRFKERRGGGGGGGYGRQPSNCSSSSYNNRRFNNKNYSSNYNSPSKSLPSSPVPQHSPLPLSPNKSNKRDGSPVLNSPVKQQQLHRPMSDEENWD